MQRNTEKLIELIDNGKLKSIGEMLDNSETISLTLHNPFSTIEADKPVKHIFESGKIETLPSGAKYRVDENGCWHKI